MVRAPDRTTASEVKGGFVQGPEAIRAYWTEQWSEINPHVEPVAFHPEVIHEYGSNDVVQTAWQAMFDLARLGGGQSILITSTSGGIGSLAGQPAKHKGAHVIGMASGRNEEFVRGLGVDEFVDYTRQPFEEVVKDVDMVFDTVGGDTFQRAFHPLKTGGFLVTSVAFPRDEAQRYRVDVAPVQCKPCAEQLAAIRELVDAGKLKAHVATVPPLVEGKQALALSKAGSHARQDCFGNRRIGTGFPAPGVEGCVRPKAASAERGMNRSC